MQRSDEDGPVEDTEHDTPAPTRPKRSVRTIATELWHQKPGPREPREPRPNVLTPTKQLVDGLDRVERSLGIASVVFAVLLALIGYLASRHSATKSVHDAATFFLVSNLVFAGILSFGLALRRRALLGFGCFLYGLEQAFSYHALVLGLPFLGLGGWLIIRANQKQKQDRAAGTDRRGTRAPSTTTTSRAGKPKASKRYTPPKRSAGARHR